jgi:hypothetical protein
MAEISPWKIVGKVFTIAGYVGDWYENAKKDDVITVQECAELGANVCRILGLKTEIEIK